MLLRYAISTAVLGTTVAAGFAQLPSIPAAPVAPVAAPAVPTVPGVSPLTPAAPRNIYSFFMMTPDQKAQCAAKKLKFCQSPLGQLLNNVAKPASAISGGILPSCCPPSTTDPNAPNPADLNKPATEAEGAAARIKQQEADAPKRREAVRYLGTVNCKRFPEAETALIGALLTDTNECVRFEAALALARGCCCTTKTIKALTATANGESADGNPAETSARVRTVAAHALSRCCGTADTSPKEPPPELPPERPTPEAAAKRAEFLDREKAVAEGRKAAAQFLADPARSALVTGRQSVFDAVRYATATAPPTLVPAPLGPPAVVPVAAPAPTVVQASAVVPAATRPTSAVPPTGQRSVFDVFSASRGGGR